jgi:Zn-dependent M28 family amino/carboxypeptidase
MKKSWFIGLFVFAALAAKSTNAPDGARWWSFVEFLASDKLEGRNTGSEGHRKAAEYVAAQFERDGLKPAGESGYIQPVKFVTKELDESRSSLTLERKGQPESVKLGDEAIIGTRVDPVPSLEAELVFVGHGLNVPEIKYDDFAGLDTKGKIAVYLSGAPASLSSALAAHYQSGKERWNAFKKAGIVGGIAIQNPKHMDLPWARIAANRSQMTMQLAAPGMNDTEDEKITINWNPAHADELLAGTGHTLDEIVPVADSGKQLPRFAIPAKIKVQTVVRHGAVESQNIAAVWPGSDPILKNEYVAMSAHIDHLGIGTPVNGDAIFNGAMDNAAGVASLLDIAAHLKETNAKPKRSILFVAVTGEEKGLLGSQYFAAHPTVPSGSMVADINIDEFLPLFPLKILTVYGLDESTLGDDIRAVARQAGVSIETDPEPARNIFIRSDQYSFVRHGIPALMPEFGALKGSPEEAALRKWNAERYHAVSDDLNQPVDKPAAGEFNQLVARLVERVANADTKPSWKPNSFFRRFAN